MTRVFVLSLLWAATGIAAEIDYVRDIKPLLLAKCTSCHGAVRQEAGLRLDAGALIRQGSDEGPVVDTETPQASRLLARVASADPEQRMPPEGEGESLTAEQIQRLVGWIQAGASYPAGETIPDSPAEHWAYQPIQRPQLPVATAAEHPVDAFVVSSLQSADLQPLSTAAPRTRLRRVFLDLIGLPPTLVQQRNFQRDASQDAWSVIVDKLLSHPAYGERWGRHWMDVWRYSDWDGYQNQLRGSQRHIWRWRDWIIESLNEDKGYDRMIVEMLAGDEVAPEDLSTVRATGFLARNYHHSNRDIWLDATVEHTAKAFLAMTINCARCHDHKYDPLAQTEYYALRAIFEPHQVRTERLPGESDLMHHGLARVFDADLDAATYVYLGGNEKQPDKEHPVAAAPPRLLSLPYTPQPVVLPLKAAIPQLREFVQQEDLAAARLRLRSALAQLENVSRQHSGELQVAQHRVVAAEAELASLQARWQADRAKLLPAESEAGSERLAERASEAERTARLAAAALLVAERRRDWQQAKQKQPAAEKAGDAEAGEAEKALRKAERQLEQLHESCAGETTDYEPVITKHPRRSSGRRRALASWIVHPQNPLTARVCVNHIWLRHFGQPLVDNMFDFGLRSPRPVHHELLDYLAAELIDSGWSMKHLHRLILTSQAYQRASAGDDATMASNGRLDPDNRLLWRAPIRRLEAEIIRDSMLFVAGYLDSQQGGPDVDYQAGESVPRRSMYFRHAYEKQMTMLTVFDGAGTTECYRRSESVIPQQALALSNSSLAIDQARRLARQLTARHAGDTAFVQAAFEIVLNRECSEQELLTCTEFLKRQARLLATPGDLTSFPGESTAQVPPARVASRRARENLIHVLFNHNDFVTVR